MVSTRGAGAAAGVSVSGASTTSTSQAHPQPSTSAASTSSASLLSCSNTVTFFSTGERVLCYEPDPTKAKVLYDSKVIQVVPTQDDRGRSTVHYLIHFQGWNSSWDRCVSEDYVLKDTDENRNLQRSLAEKSQLHLGAYLYRKERKKPPANTNQNKRSRVFDDEVSSGSSKQAEEDAVASDSSGSVTSGGVGVETRPVEIPTVSNVNISLGPGLRDRLTNDYNLIVKRNKLVTLPAKPNVLEIIESCVKRQLNKITNRESRPRRVRNVPITDLSEELDRLHILRQVADGLRVYFDFILGDQLLYPQEDLQYQDAYVNSVINTPKNSIGKDSSNNNITIKKEDMSDTKESRNLAEECARLSVSPIYEEKVIKTELPDAVEEPLAKRLRSRKSPITTPPQPPEAIEAPSPTSADILGHINTELGTNETKPSASGSPGTADPAANTDPNNTTSEALQKAINWKLVPSDNPACPSTIYGAVHLSRLFVKLPDYLNVIIMPETKLKTILECINIFIEYLEEHDEWFSESYYYDSTASAS